jgi:hypothetical protein
MSRKKWEKFENLRGEKMAVIGDLLLGMNYLIFDAFTF